MAKGKKKKSKKKDAAVIQQNAQSLRKFLKLYEQFSNEQNGVSCPEVTKYVRGLMEEGDSISKVNIDRDEEIIHPFIHSFQVFLRPVPLKAIKPVEITTDPPIITEPVSIVRISKKFFFSLSIISSSLNSLRHMFDHWFVH